MANLSSIIFIFLLMIVFIILQIILCRETMCGLFRSVVISGMLSYGALFSVYFLLTDNYNLQFFDQFISNILIFTSFAVIYFHILNMGETARRVRIARELFLAGGSLAFDDLEKKYGSREIISRRIERLVSKKQIYISGGKLYYRSSIMGVVSVIIAKLRWLILGAVD